jgi:hypothetical protein
MSRSVIPLFSAFFKVVDDLEKTGVFIGTRFFNELLANDSKN